MWPTLSLYVLWVPALSVGFMSVLFYLPIEVWFIRLIDHIRDTLSALLTPDLTDREREKALRIAAIKMLTSSSIGLLGALGLSLCMYGADLLTFSLYHTSLTHPSLLVLITLVSVGFVRWRQGRSRSSSLDQYSEQAYPPIAQAFHRLALQDHAIRSASFRWERQGIPTNVLKKEPQGIVWVCGLARAGTTLMTEFLYETDAFCSLTYRDMPLVLAPGRWRWLSRWSSLRGPDRVERAHGDGISVGLDSPEALEEVFWSTIAPEIYQHPDRLTSHEPTQAQLDDYQAYLHCVLQSRPDKVKRFLSKNNNHLIRLPHLLNRFPSSRCVIPLRPPVAQAESLLRQHLRWTARHAEDSFSLTYMRWLCHFEFGADYRPFEFNLAHDHTPTYQDPHQLEHWLHRWLAAYQHIQRLHSSQIILIDYQHLVDHPYHSLKLLCHALDLEVNEERLKSWSQRIKPSHHSSTRMDLCPELVAQSNRLYEELSARCINFSLTSSS